MIQLLFKEAETGSNCFTEAPAEAVSAAIPFEDAREPDGLGGTKVRQSSRGLAAAASAPFGSAAGLIGLIKKTSLSADSARAILQAWMTFFHDLLSS